MSEKVEIDFPHEKIYQIERQVELMPSSHDWFK